MQKTILEQGINRIPDLQTDINHQEEQGKHMFRQRGLNTGERRGAAVVEMAVVLPVFMLVVMGIVEFGRGMMSTQLITNAAREGAREAILNGSTNTAVETLVKNYVSQACNVKTSAVTVNINITPGTGNTDPKNILADSDQGDLISVEVRVPFNDLSYITGSFLAGKTIKGFATMRHE